MAELLDIVSWVLLSLGGIFVFIGGLGALRMPDLYTRMHAASVTDSIGPVLIITGIMLQAGISLYSIKLAAILVFLLLTGPTASNALASAALLAGTEPGGKKRLQGIKQMTALFGIFILTLLVITALAIVQTRNLFVAVMLAGIFSLLLAVVFFLLDAADVALTEAAVGAGISTVLFLGALALTAEREQAPSANRLVALLVVSTTTLAVIYATFDKPRLGDPDAPTQTHVAPWYLEQTPRYIDIPNVVTAVLGGFRGYDTLGEVFVVLTAGIGVLFLLGKAAPARARTSIAGSDDQGLRHYLIPRVVGRMLIPFILLFGLYVQFHGEYGPGGGFQAGAIIAAAIILYALLEGEQQALRVLPRWLLSGLMAGGALLYGMVGVVCLLLGGNFLDYSVLASDPVKGQQLGILLIEAGVGITVTGVLLSIFHAFAARGET